MRDAIERFLPSQKEFLAHDRRRGGEFVVQKICRQKFGLIIMTEDGRLAVEIGHVNPATTGNGRCIDVSQAAETNRAGFVDSGCRFDPRENSLVMRREKVRLLMETDGPFVSELLWAKSLLLRRCC